MYFSKDGDLHMETCSPSHSNDQASIPVMEGVIITDPKRRRTNDLPLGEDPEANDLECQSMYEARVVHQPRLDQ